MSAVRRASRARGFQEDFPDTPSDALMRAPAPRRDGQVVADGLAFAALRAAYRRSGGLARGSDAARLLGGRTGADFAELASPVVSDDVFGFDWDDVFWVSMFQFELRDLSVRPGPRRVLAELGTSFDGWTLALWFARPDAGLGNRKPVDLVDSDLPAVLEAARLERFTVNR